MPRQLKAAEREQGHEATDVKAIRRGIEAAVNRLPRRGELGLKRFPG